MRRLLPALMLSTHVIAACDDPARAENTMQHGVPERVDPPKLPREGLLASTRHADDDTEASATPHWNLPTDARAMILRLLQIVAREDLQHLDDVLAPDARWGLPDRREFQARSIASNAHAFSTELRSAATRFDPDTPLICPTVAAELEAFVNVGAEPMWCFYRSADGLDLLVFRLQVGYASAVISYVGLFATRPVQEIPVIDRSPSPALFPLLELPAPMEASG